MKRFEYRHPRFSVNLAVQFSMAQNTHAVRCTNISATGLRLDVADSVVPSCRGTVLLRYQSQTLELKARVANSNGRHRGLQFLYDSPEEQASLEHLLTRMMAPHVRPRISLVPKGNGSVGDSAQRC